MMPRGWLAALPLALAAANAMACINSYSFELKALTLQGDTEGAQRVMARIEAEHEAEQRKDPNDPELTNDLAVVRIATGKYQEAVELLRALENASPGRAATAANLGTALELTGKDQEALDWIREGYRRDPREHQGSEWLHVKILEAKIAMAGDPAWRFKNTVLGIGFGSEDVPRASATQVTDHTGSARSLTEAQSAVRYQLIERVYFVKPLDPIVADLYMAHADLTSVLYPPQPNKPNGGPCHGYQKAVLYGYYDLDLAQRPLKHCTAARNSAPT